MAKRVGRRAELGSPAAQLMKLRLGGVDGWRARGGQAGRDGEGEVFGETKRIVLESALLGSMLVGR